MDQVTQPVETALGVIAGRDAVYLDEVNLDYRNRSVEFVGEVNSRLCSISQGGLDFVGFTLVFSGVLGLRMVELDFSDTYCTSSFDRVLNSVWIARMRKADSAGKVRSTHAHYVFATYDDVFEVVSTGYELRLGEDARRR